MGHLLRISATKPRAALLVEHPCSAALEIPRSSYTCTITPHPPTQLFMEAVGSRAVSSARVPVYLAVNKSDMGAKCHTLRFIKSRLEQEIQVCRSPPTEWWTPKMHPRCPESRLWRLPCLEDFPCTHQLM